MNMEESLHNILDTTIAYEKIALYKGIAGLYYRIAIALVISLFGLLIIDALSTDAIYFDKGFAHMQFTLVQVGQVVVGLAFIGDLAFQFTKFIIDQQFTELFNDKAKKIQLLKNATYALIVLFIGIMVITLVSFVTPTVQQVSWEILALYFGVLFLLIAKYTNHKPTYIAGVMNSLNAGFLFFSPDPVWMVFLMVLISSAFITSVVSYIQALE